MPTDWLLAGVHYVIALVAFSGAVWFAGLATFDSLVAFGSALAPSVGFAFLGFVSLVAAEDERRGEFFGRAAP